MQTLNQQGVTAKREDRAKEKPMQMLNAYLDVNMIKVKQTICRVMAINCRTHSKCKSTLQDEVPERAHDIKC